ncbi:hypothetical protein K7X08_004935 [Anisodus acutangulus]|uniref:ATP-citrate synthase/succinyl-CoA ligase C-terminal domain-containing protein n=2 Tax=Anisodus TaxID=243963 RepID=A0A9Q1MG10_9SOLA|nr:hypothetical protein K7X08_004935 [Anisodus acutangulus]KAK4366104.1 hypothetical protein RND71_013984 [Anisodus tanguticus]
MCNSIYDLESAMKLHAYMLILPFCLKVQLKVPVVVRLEGTNVDQGKRILKESGMTLVTAEDLDDAAEKAVKAAAS